MDEQKVLKKDESKKGDFIKFLGTGGARVVVSKQIRSSAGAWLHLNGVNLFLDPGPGALVKCWSSRPALNPANLDAILLSHRHIDHSGDMNALTEAFTEAGFKKRGLIFLPADALNEEPVLYRYLFKAVEGIEYLEAGKTYRIGDLTWTTPVRHLHPVETYGFVFKLTWGKLAWITDTLYFPELSACYQSDLLVLNVPRLQGGGPPQIQHLCLADVRQLLQEIKPRVAVMTHFGMTMLRARPWELAERLSDETGVRVIAARDGMTLDLAQLMS